MLATAKNAGFFAAHGVNNLDGTDDGVVIPLGGVLELSGEQKLTRYAGDVSYDESVARGRAALEDWEDTEGTVLVYSGFLRPASAPDDAEAIPVLLVDMIETSSKEHLVIALPYVIDNGRVGIGNPNVVLYPERLEGDADGIQGVMEAFFNGISENAIGHATWMRLFDVGQDIARERDAVAGVADAVDEAFRETATDNISFPEKNDQ